MEGRRRLQRNPEIVYREEEDGAFVFDPESGNLKFMNRTAKEAFLLLDRPREMDALVRSFCRLYPEVDGEKIRSDLLAFLTEIERNGFATVVETDSGGN
jgi:hypothetical protein